MRRVVAGIVIVLASLLAVWVVAHARKIARVHAEMRDALFPLKEGTEGPDFG